MVPRQWLFVSESADSASVAGRATGGAAGATGVPVDSLRVLLKHLEPAEMPVSVVTPEGSLPRAKVRSFVFFAATRLRQKLAAAPAVVFTGTRPPV